MRTLPPKTKIIIISEFKIPGSDEYITKGRRGELIKHDSGDSYEIIIFYEGVNEDNHNDSRHSKTLASYGKHFELEFIIEEINACNEKIKDIMKLKETKIIGKKHESSLPLPHLELTNDVAFQLIYKTLGDKMFQSFISDVNDVYGKYLQKCHDGEKLFLAQYEVKRKK